MSSGGIISTELVSSNSHSSSPTGTSTDTSKATLHSTSICNCSMTEDHKRDKQDSGNHNPLQDDHSIDTNQATGDHDDEFVSDLHQASSKDIAEADEAMKKLGLTKVWVWILVSIYNFALSRTILSGKRSWRGNLTSTRWLTMRLLMRRTILSGKTRFKKCLRPKQQRNLE